MFLSGVAKKRLLFRVISAKNIGTRQPCVLSVASCSCFERTRKNMYNITTVRSTVVSYVDGGEKPKGFLKLTC